MHKKKFLHINQPDLGVSHYLTHISRFLVSHALKIAFYSNCGHVVISALVTCNYVVFFLSFRYNKLLEVISLSLSDIVKALKGSVVMSSALELMARSLFNNAVPDMWKAKARHTQLLLYM